MLEGDFTPRLLRQALREGHGASRSRGPRGCGSTCPGLALAKQLYEAIENGGGRNLALGIWLLYAQATEREAAGVLGGVTTRAAGGR